MRQFVVGELLVQPAPLGDATTPTLGVGDTSPLAVMSIVSAVAAVDGSHWYTVQPPTPHEDR